MKISTKTGDKGESRLYSGRKLPKASLVFDVLGNLDELNATLGLCKSSLTDEFREEFLSILEIFQKDIFVIMAIIGNDMKNPKEAYKIDRKNVLLLEQYIEKFEEEIGEIGEFVMPGDCELSARLHFTRTVCRRTERSLVKYHDEILSNLGGVSEFILQYINRLSDLLFLMAYKACKS
jgi:cob(I)alamin adenosyltransferase